jgi:ubiquitin-small subunit ribosomal protein S27Ae
VGRREKGRVVAGMADGKGKSKAEVSIYKFYSIEGDKVIKNKRDCPRCGKGVFMAEHKNRHTCGKCGFTEFTHKDHSKPKK